MRTRNLTKSLLLTLFVLVALFFALKTFEKNKKIPVQPTQVKADEEPSSDSESAEIFDDPNLKTAQWLMLEKASGGKSQSQPMTIRYPSGAIKESNDWLPGKKEGIFKGFYENGTLQFEVQYGDWVSGLTPFHGPFKGYYESGKPLMEFQLENGWLTDPGKFYDEKGNHLGALDEFLKEASPGDKALGRLIQKLFWKESWKAPTADNLSMLGDWDGYYFRFFMALRNRQMRFEKIKETVLADDKAKIGSAIKAWEEKEPEFNYWAKKVVQDANDAQYLGMDSEINLYLGVLQELSAFKEMDEVEFIRKLTAALHLDLGQVEQLKGVLKEEAAFGNQEKIQGLLKKLGVLDRALPRTAGHEDMVWNRDRMKDIVMRTMALDMAPLEGKIMGLLKPDQKAEYILNRSQWNPAAVFHRVKVEDLAILETLLLYYRSVEPLNAEEVKPFLDPQSRLYDGCMKPFQQWIDGNNGKLTRVVSRNAQKYLDPTLLCFGSSGWNYPPRILPKGRCVDSLSKFGDDKLARKRDLSLAEKWGIPLALREAKLDQLRDFSAYGKTFVLADYWDEESEQHLSDLYLLEPSGPLRVFHIEDDETCGNRLKVGRLGKNTPVFMENILQSGSPTAGSASTFYLLNEDATLRELGPGGGYFGEWVGYDVDHDGVLEQMVQEKLEIPPEMKTNYKKCLEDENVLFGKLLFSKWNDSKFVETYTYYFMYSEPDH